jgi:hypothetical protein
VDLDDPAKAGAVLTSLFVRARGVGPDPPRLASNAGDANGRVAADGSFEFRGTFGPTMISLEPASVRWAIRAILRGDRDVTGVPLDLRHGEAAENLRVIVSTNPAVLEGELKDREGKTVDGTIVIYPDDQSRWILGSPLVRATRSDSAGRFTITGLPPGRYRCAGVEYIEEGAWSDPRILESLSRDAVGVTLIDRATTRIVLSVNR